MKTLFENFFQINFVICDLTIVLFHFDNQTSICIKIVTHLQFYFTGQSPD